MFDILLKDGLIIDKTQGIHYQGYVGIRDGKICEVGENSANVDAKRVYDMRGKIVTPGLIDVHCHPNAGFREGGVAADEMGVNSGVTFLCDGGSAGAANLKTFRLLIIDRAKTDVVCFLNLATTGLLIIPEICSEHDVNIDLCRRVIEANADIIKGVKIRFIQALADSLGMKAVESAKKLASDFRMPLMVHLGAKRRRAPNDTMDDFSRTAVSLLDRGDILSHYVTWEPGGLILPDGTVYPELLAARERGVYLDSCHGLSNFSFAVARIALAQGLIPSIISTDMSAGGQTATQSMPVVMSKFLNMGLTLDQVIEMTTVAPARALGEEARRGSLKPGINADVTVMELLKGDYLFSDGLGGELMSGDQLLEPRMVIKGGEVMPAYSRYLIPKAYAPL
jgi:dihydroorotase